MHWLAVILTVCCGCVLRGAAGSPPPPPVAAEYARGKTIVVIGAGYAGLAAACELRQLGYEVTVLDKLDAPGGRAQRQHSPGGFVHDAGPSWYWMPDVFDEVLARYGQLRADHYNITRLDPAYRIVFAEGEVLDVPGTAAGFLKMASRMDPESDMAGFFADGEQKYNVGVREAIWQVPAWPLAAWMLTPAAWDLSLLTSSLEAHIARFARNPRLRMVLEWPSKFVGVDAAAAPSLYSLLTWSGHAQGTWMPSPHGMAAPARALHATAEALGVRFELGADAEVVRIDAEAEGGLRVSGVRTAGGATIAAHGVVAAADYHHVEQRLLPPALRRHTQAWWDKQVMAPGAVVFLLCVAGRVPALARPHSLFVDDAALPFYASSDEGTADALPNQTSVFVLVPLEQPQTGAPQDEPDHAALLARVLARLRLDASRLLCGAEGYGPAHYAADFHAWRGNAFGLANTLGQTLWLKPAMDALAPNLVYAGHLTHPGPGVPPALVSGILAARLLHAQLAPVTLASLAPALTALALLLAAAAAAHTRRCADARALHRGGRTYFLAAAALPTSVFLRIAALYAAFRRADDLVDCTHRQPAAARAADLDAFEAAVLATPASRQGYPPAMWRTFFGAMRADCRDDGPPPPLQTAGGADSAPPPLTPLTLVMRDTAELVAYMDGSAAVLGEFMLPALLSGSEQHPDAALVAAARALGYAFQLTNMCRDVVEDGRLGRQYLPQDACARRGIADLRAAAAAPAGTPAAAAFRGLLEDMFALANGWYAQADAGIARLPPRTRPAIVLARRAYHGLHAAIRAARYRLEPRVAVPFTAKLAAAAALLPPAQLARVLPAEALVAAAGVAAAWGPVAAVLLAVWVASEALQGPPAPSYAAFHAIWTLPAAAALAAFVWLARRDVWGSAAGATELRRAALWTALLAAVAFAYTTPWDAYLIARGVWASAPARVAGAMAGVPLEEYAFFALATALAAGARTAVWPAQRWADVARPAPAPAGTAALAALGAAGLALAAYGPERTLYLGLLLAWAAPPLLLQWAVGGHVLAAHAGPLARAVVLAGGAMALMDRWAIARCIWVLNPEYSLWPWARGVHPEEVLFFLLTAAMCAGGLTLALWVDAGCAPALRLAGWTLGRRAPAAAAAAKQGPGGGGSGGDDAAATAHQHFD